MNSLCDVYDFVITSTTDRHLKNTISSMYVLIIGITLSKNEIVQTI